LSSPDTPYRPGRPQRRSLQRQRGFSLIETCIALVVLMIVALGVSSLFLYAVSNNTGANDRELSMAVAQQRVEWLRSIPFNTTNATKAYAYPGGGLAATNAPVIETTVSGGRTYEVQTTITDVKTETGASVAALAEPATVKTLTVSVRPVNAINAWNQVNTVFAGVTLTTQRVMLHAGLNSAP
jgi:Tfp pilus assembly protein PilV